VSEGEGRVKEEKNSVVKERSMRRVLRQRLCEEMKEMNDLAHVDVLHQQAR
jgi:hypothetical protein